MAASTFDHDPLRIENTWIKNMNEMLKELKKYQMVFRVWILWSKHAGCCETWEKRKKNTSRQASVFSFSKVEQHPKCLDQRIQTQKTIRYFYYKITTIVI